MRELYSELKAVKTIDPIVGNNTTEGTGVGVDLQGYEGALMVAHIGLSGDTLSGSVYITPSLQESDVLGSGYADAAAADVEGAFTVIDAAAEDEVVQAVGYKGAKRFIRLLLTFTGTHTVGTPISGVAVLGSPRHGPAGVAQLP